MRDSIKPENQNTGQNTCLINSPGGVMNRFAKLLMSVAGLALAVTLSTGCPWPPWEEHNDNPEPKYINTPTAQELLSKQSPVTTRELINFGYKDNNYILVHKIGTIKNAVAGFLTTASYSYNGARDVTITYTLSEARTRSESFSTTNVRRITVGVSASAGVSVGSTIKVDLTASLTSEFGTSVEYGTEHSTTFGSDETYPIMLIPEMGPGDYAAVAVLHYDVYQTTYYNPVTGQTISKDVWFTQSKEEPNVGMKIVKSKDDGTFGLNILDSIEPGTIPVIDVAPEDIEKCRLYLLSEKRTFEFQGRGNDMIIANINNAGWDKQKYEKLDTISSMFNMRDSYGNLMDLDFLKSQGFKRVGLKLQYTSEEQKKDALEMQLKIINKTTTKQFSESGGLRISNNSYDFAIFPLSNISTNDQVEVEWRTRQKGVTSQDRVTIKANRIYIWTFDNY